MSLFVGYEIGTAKEVKIPIFHQLVTGQTRLSGKCVRGDANILLSNGKMMTARELYEQKIWNQQLGGYVEVFSLDADFKIVNDQIVAIEKNGVKPLFKVTFGDGHTVTLTDNHPLLTIYGWKPLRELYEGVHVALPRHLPIKGKKTIDLHAAKILGFLLSEGSLQKNRSGGPSFSFTSSNPKFANEFDEELGFHELELQLKAPCEYYLRQKIRGSHRRDLLKFVSLTGLKIAKSRDKEIPSCIMESDESTIANFLLALFKGDGVYIKSRHTIGYCSISEKMIRQVQHLLLRFGIKSSLIIRDSNKIREGYKSFELAIAKADNGVFFSKIGIFNDKFYGIEKAKQRWKWDVIPLPIARITNRAKNGAKKRDGFIDLPGRDQVLEFSKYIRPRLPIAADYLHKLATSDIVWIRIRRIESIGEDETYDVQTEKTGNLIVDDVLVHNTTLLKALARQAAERGFKILVVDSKTNFADYETFGQEVPICLQESMDSLIIIGLLESIFRRKITVYYATLTRLAENAKTYNDVIKNAEQLRDKSSGFQRDACIALIDLLRRLQVQTTKVKTTATLTLPYQINRMSINDFDLEAQQLIVKSTLDEALRKFKKLIIILDESYKFCPQKYSSACMKSILDFTTQSGATECYLWMGTQFLAPTNKDAMKTMAIKLLGTQDHDTECEHTLDLIPFIKGKFTKDTIMRLALGHFIVVTKTSVQTVYACPEYADKNECREVALGRRDPKNIHYLVSITEEQVKEVQKKKPTVDVDKLDEHVRMPPISEKTVTVHISKVEKATPKPVVPERKRIKPSYLPSEARVPMNERFELIENNLESLRLKLSDLMKMLKEADKPMQVVQVQQNGKTVPVDLKQVIYNVKAGNIIKHFQLNTDSNNGKVMWLAKEGFFSDWRTANEVLNALVEKRWAIPRGSIYSTLNFLAKKGFLGVTENNKKEDVWALPENVKFIE